MSEVPIVVVIGAGDGLGASLCRTFAKEGYLVCGARRNGHQLEGLIASIESSGGQMKGFSLDARSEEQINTFFDELAGLGTIKAVVFNPGANVPMTILDTPSKKFYKIWEMACFAGFLIGKKAAEVLVEKGEGSIIFTGATASVRGAAGFGAFASAKSGLRTLAQSMAKELGPQNVHVSHVIVDGMIDSPFIQELLGEDIEAKREQQTILDPDEIAKNYLMLHQQAKNAWTFELDLRPYTEKWN